ncbi:MAG: TIGR02302 family protein [Inquilinus sp.]|nr:TIGR02302 family protein [Inquilinus sp.]
MKRRIATLLGPGAEAEALALPHTKLIAVWLVLMWERLWPALWLAVSLAGLFAAVALFDVLPLLPGWLHLAALVGFAAAVLLAAIRGLRAFRPPTAADARRRLETASGVPHRPLTALLDHQATGTADPASRRLWQLHRQRLREAMAKWRVGMPSPGVPARDRYGLRAFVFLALLLAGIGAGGDWAERLDRAFSPHFGRIGLADTASLDLFITPPDYTGAAPLYLSAADIASAEGTPATPEIVQIPVDSVVLARVTGGGTLPNLAVDEAATPFEAIDGRSYEITHTLTAGSRIAVEQGRDTLGAWPIAIVPDAPPTIAFVTPTAESERAALRLDFQAADDYGIETVTARLELTAEATAAGPGLDTTPIEIALSVPGRRPREARAASYHDLTPHPWAGQPVQLTLVATDSAGQEGLSETVDLVLPEREFTHPVARAVIEQRRSLMLDPDSHPIVSEVLDTLSLRPDRYYDDAVVFLALRTASRRLALATDVATAIEPVQELLWDTALRIEDGELSIAERELREAQQALMEALDGDATDQEIRELMDELRQALDEYLKAMQENLMEQLARGELPEMMPDPNSQTIDRDQLNEMLEQMQDLAESGSRDAARDLLAQLQEMLENLQAGVMQQQQQQQQNQSNQAMELMEQLQDLTRAQQELLDRSFRESQQNQQQGQQGEQGQQSQQQGQQGQQGSQSGSQFGREGAAIQEALRRALGDMMRQMDDLTGGIPMPLGRAEQSMRQSEQALSQGQAGQSIQPQADSVDQLQQGLQDFVDQVLEQMAQQNNGQIGSMMQQLNSGRDPLGRPLPNSGGMNTEEVGIPDQADVQRAREILNELRRRLGQRSRSSEELDYIERLIRQF